MFRSRPFAPRIWIPLLIALSSMSFVSQSRAASPMWASAQRGTCSIVGKIALSGRRSMAGVRVEASGDASTITAADGRFRLRTGTPGIQRLEASSDGYLTAVSSRVECAADSEIQMADVTLVGGDVDYSGRIDRDDIAQVGRSYRACRGSARYGSVTDLDRSGCTDLFDLVHTAIHVGRSGPTTWTVDDTVDPTPVSYARDLQPVLTEHCGLCHGASAGLQVDSYEHLMDGGNNGPVVIPGDPQGSSLYLRVSGQVRPPMPPGGVDPPPGLAEAIRRWILDGAPNN